VGDVLLSLNGQQIDSAAMLRKAFAPRRWGDVVTVRIERDGQEQQLLIPIRRQANN
jgi:S1-C subfamily serine protease